MAKPRDNRQKDLLRPALEEIVDLGHPLVRLAREIDVFLRRRPPFPARLNDRGLVFGCGVVIGSVHKFGYGHKFGGAASAPVVA